jgi:CRP-like cAMP-binding protein
MAGRPPLWNAPVTFLSSSLEKAGVHMAVHCFETKETIYIRGDPDWRLYCLTEGVVKLYKSYWGYKEAIVTLLE